MPFVEQLLQLLDPLRQLGAAFTMEQPTHLPELLSHVARPALASCNGTAAAAAAPGTSRRRRRSAPPWRSRGKPAARCLRPSPLQGRLPLALASWCAVAIKRPCESVPATLAPAVHDPDARRRVRHCVARLPVQPKPVRPEATNSFPGSYMRRDRPVVVFLHPCARNP